MIMANTNFIMRVNKNICLSHSFCSLILEKIHMFSYLRMNSLQKYRFIFPFVIRDLKFWINLIVRLKMQIFVIQIKNIKNITKLYEKSK